MERSATFLAWASRYCSRQVWRLHNQFDLDDLLQEAWIVFDRVERKYTDVTDRQLMALYKISMVNHIHSLARKTRKLENEIPGFDLHSDDSGQGLDQMLVDDTCTGSEFICRALDSSPLALAAVRAILAADRPILVKDAELDRHLNLPAGTNSATALREFLRS